MTKIRIVDYSFEIVIAINYVFTIYFELCFA